MRECLGIKDDNIIPNCQRIISSNCQILKSYIRHLKFIPSSLDYISYELEIHPYSCKLFSS